MADVDVPSLVGVTPRWDSVGENVLTRFDYAAFGCYAVPPASPSAPASASAFSAPATRARTAPGFAAYELDCGVLDFKAACPTPSSSLPSGDTLASNALFSDAIFRIFEAAGATSESVHPRAPSPPDVDGLLQPEAAATALDGCARASASLVSGSTGASAQPSTAAATAAASTPTVVSPALRQRLLRTGLIGTCEGGDEAIARMVAGLPSTHTSAPATEAAMAHPSAPAAPTPAAPALASDAVHGLHDRRGDEGVHTPPRPTSSASSLVPPATHAPLPSSPEASLRGAPLSAHDLRSVLMPATVSAAAAWASPTPITRSLASDFAHQWTTPLPPNNAAATSALLSHSAVPADAATLASPAARMAALYSRLDAQYALLAAHAPLPAHSAAAASSGSVPQAAMDPLDIVRALVQEARALPPPQAYASVDALTRAHMSTATSTGPRPGALDGGGARTDRAASLVY